ncbi:ATPase family AAA domain-containing protein 1-A [Hypomontagnella monticulosa]|nr:ATPase family AAA domain-containing protein 1-A [Hypomontagnella monticulosa]
MDGPDKYTLGEQTKSLPDLQVPGWFLAKRVKTPQRLNRISIPIRVLEYLEPENSTAAHKNTGQETVSPSNVADGVYGVSEEYYSELRDTVNAAFVRNSKNELPLDESCVFVSSTTKNSSGFLEALVLHLAKDIEAILIEVDIEDLNDLADHFQRQEDAQSVAECQDRQPNHDAALDTEVLINAAKEYFAASCALDRTDEAWKKSQNAVEALLNTPRSLVMGPVESRNEDEPVAKHYTNLTGVFEDTVILCVRDLDRLGYSTQTKIIARLQEGIKDRRRSKEHFILLFTTIEGEDSYLYMDYDYTYPPDEVSLASKFRLTMNSFTCAEKHGAADTEKITGTMNTRRLKRALRQRAYQAFPSELLEPFADWSLYGIDCYSTPLGESLWSRKDLHRAAIQIVGRSRSKSQLNMEDIRAVLSRLRLYRMPEGSGGQSDSESIVKSQDDAEDKWKEKIDAVKGSCNTFEKELISSVVNPADIATSFDDVILDQEIKEIVKHVVMLSTFNVTEKSSTLLHHVRIKGVLLYGPPGCGKTHLSRAIAKAFGASMLAIDAATVQSKWVGETEKYIKATFSLTEKLSPCVLFIDEADALFYRRSSEDRSWERNALTQFLQQMDGLLKSDKSPLVVVATNRPADLDDAFLRRLPQKIMINLPHEMARIQILRIYLKPDDIDPSVNIESIAAATEGYSASDLRDLCAEAAVIWFIEKQIDKLDDDSLKSLGHLSLNMSHISKALKKIRPTVSRRSQRDLVEFSERFNPDLAHVGKAGL